MAKLKGYYCSQAGCNRFATEGIAKKTWIAKFTGKDGKAHAITCSTCLKKFNPLLINHETGEVTEASNEQLASMNGDYTQEQVNAMNKQRLEEACAVCDHAAKINDCPCQTCKATTDADCVDCPCDNSRCKWMVE